MEHFRKSHFTYSGGYLGYIRQDGSHVFIARLKRAADSKGPWITALIKSWTVDEYLAAVEASTPLKAMETKGFMLTHIKRRLRERGYPTTRSGFEQMITDQIDRSYSELKAQGAIGFPARDTPTR